MASAAASSSTTRRPAEVTGAVYTGSPEQPLARVYGENPNGTWTLSITDDTAGFAGTLNAARLDITTVPELPNEVRRSVRTTPQMAMFVGPHYSYQTIAGAGSFITRVRVTTRITHPASGELDLQLLSPTSSVILASGRGEPVRQRLQRNAVERSHGQPGDRLRLCRRHCHAAGTGERAGQFDGSAGQWAMGAGGPGQRVGQQRRHRRMDVGGVHRILPLGTACASRLRAGDDLLDQPDGGAGPSRARPTASSGTTTSTIQVSDAGASMWDVNLRTRLRHTYNNDLDVTLTSPRGTTVPLTTRNGSDRDDVFNGTWWDDQADLPVTDADIVNGVALRAVVPEGALAALRAENPSGTWTLTIRDNVAGDIGMLDAWTLDIVALSAQPTFSVTPFLTQVGMAIPDGVQGGLTSDLVVGDEGPTSLASVSAGLILRHLQPSQLDIFLTSPAGTTVTLSTANGGARAEAFDRPSLPTTTIGRSRTSTSAR